jgi:phosphatidylglycerophosphate synthase
VSPNAERRGWQRLPDLVTATRPLWGVACGVAVATDHAALGGVLYLVGYLSDVVDGWLARRLGVASDAGTRLDGIADETFHLAVGLGLVWWAITAPALWVLATLVLLFLAVRVVRRWIGVHTVLGKGIGALTRLVMFGIFVVLAAPDQRPWLLLLGLAVFGPTYAYEVRVTLHDRETGERPLR